MITCASCGQQWKSLDEYDDNHPCKAPPHSPSTKIIYKEDYLQVVYEERSFSVVLSPDHVSVQFKNGIHHVLDHNTAERLGRALISLIELNHKQYAAGDTKVHAHIEYNGKE